jgi:multicomponent Na+:H+ antiporter subunit D
MLGHGLTKGCLFLVAGAVSQRSGADSDDSLREMAKRMPWSMAAFVVASLSMIGVPPTIGFFSKWYLLLGCLDEGRYLFAAVLLVSTWLNAWYFFRLIERAYFSRDEPAGLRRAEAPAPMLVPIAALAALVLISGVGSYTLTRDVLRPAIEALPRSRFQVPSSKSQELRLSSAEHLEPGTWNLERGRREP